MNAASSSPVSGHITLGPKMFENEFRNYTNWRMAWWREFFQNSVDAGATKIDITINELTDQPACHIRFDDNGCGMTREQLETVYFVLGETTKGGIGEIGGFGKARILQCFAQSHYQLLSNDWMVDGTGATYTVATSPVPRKGVCAFVNVKSAADSMTQTLHDYLKRCRINATVTINGVEWKEWTYCRNHRRDLSFGKVYTNMSKEPELLVRVNGTLMFLKSTQYRGQVIVELISDLTHNPRTILTSSRDGMEYHCQRELEDFLCSLNIDKRSALRAQTDYSDRYRGGGLFSTRKTPVVPPATTSKILTGVYPVGYTSPYFSSASTPSGFEIFDVLIDDNAKTSAVRLVISSYHPKNWDLIGEHGARNGLAKFQLLTLWQAACECALELMLKRNLAVDIRWGVGWMFDDQDEAEAELKHEDDAVFFLLNPVKSDGSMRFGVSSRKDWNYLIGLALHEAVHIRYNYHDEDYAGLLTDLMIDAMNMPLVNIVKRMTEAKTRIMNDLDVVMKAKKAAKPEETPSMFDDITDGITGGITGDDVSAGDIGRNQATASNTTLAQVRPIQVMTDPYAFSVLGITPTVRDLLTLP